jgi:hypothetical protein
MLPFVAKIWQHFFPQNLPNFSKKNYANKVGIEIFAFRALCSESKFQIFFRKVNPLLEFGQK